MRPELLTAIDVAVGDQIVIGQASFTIRGVIVREPGRGHGEFSLGPRVIIAYDDLASTGLLGFGSRARQRDAGQDARGTGRAAGEDAARGFQDDFINTRSFRSTEDQVGRDFDRAENYLSLVGLIIVILGGIAVSSVTRVFILQKIRSIAVLKCLGARSSADHLGLHPAGDDARPGREPARHRDGARSARVDPADAGGVDVDSRAGSLRRQLERGGQGMAIGVLVSLLFSVVPLLQVRFIKPSLLLRDESVRRARDWAGMAVIAVVSLALVGAHGLAGGVAQSRHRRLRGVRGTRRGASSGWPRADRRSSRRWRTRGRSRSATRSCTCRVRATRRG